MLQILVPPKLNLFSKCNPTLSQKGPSYSASYISKGRWRLNIPLPSLSMVTFKARKEMGKMILDRSVPKITEYLCISMHLYERILLYLTRVH
jgi:hypothetical protein